jgi:hypothetical protein
MKNSRNSWIFSGSTNSLQDSLNICFLNFVEMIGVYATFVSFQQHADCM